MNMTECTSSQISRYGYDPQTQIMAVEFRRGGAYEYRGVPADVFQRFVEADSKGSFHYREIKGKFQYEKVG